MDKNKLLKIIVLTFIITAFCDVVLRIISENYTKLPNIIQKNFPFIHYLVPYFEKHTLLSAALIAGFVGAVTQYIILNICELPDVKNKINIKEISYFLTVSFLTSGLIGFPMKLSGLFPHLNDTYYKKLGPVRGFYHDGVSGVIVQVILLIVMHKI